MILGYYRDIVLYITINDVKPEIVSITVNIIWHKLTVNLYLSYTSYVKISH